MTLKQIFVLSIGIFLLAAAAGCGGSTTHEPRAEAGEPEEAIAAPLAFSEPPEDGSSEAAAPSPRREEPSPSAKPARAAPEPASTQPAPRQPTQAAQPSPADRTVETDYQVTSPSPADSVGTREAADDQQSVVVPPAAPRSAADTPAYRDATPPQRPQPRYATVPEGTVIEIRLEERVASDQKRTGDQFKARLDRDIEVAGEVIFPVGTEVTGKILEASESGRVEGRAHLELALESLRRDEEKFAIRTNPIAVEAEGSKGRDAKIVGGAAAVGALIGAITGGKKGAAVGAASGAGAGTAGVLITKGDEVELPRERLLSFRLEEPLEVRVD